MKTKILALLTFVLFVSPVMAKEDFKLIHVADVSAMMDHHDAKLAMIDANNEATRQKFGIVPGARLLSSYKNFDAGKELPADKSAKLVFYCADTL